MTSKMHIEDRFECSAKSLMEILFDPTYDEAAMRAIGMKKEIVEERDTAKGKVEVVKMIPSTDLPSFMKKVVGGSSSYIETRDWDFEKMMNRWSEKTGFAPDKVDIRGTFAIKPAGDTACTRTVDGDFTVRVPFIGKKIEAWIIDSTKESFGKSTAFTKQWIKDKGLAGK